MKLERNNLSPIKKAVVLLISLILCSNFVAFSALANNVADNQNSTWSVGADNGTHGYSSTVVEERALDQVYNINGMTVMEAESCSSWDGTCSQEAYAWINYTLHFNGQPEQVNLSIIHDRYAPEEDGLGLPDNSLFSIFVFDKNGNTTILNSNSQTGALLPEQNVTISDGPFVVKDDGTISVLFHISHTSQTSLNDVLKMRIMEIEAFSVVENQVSDQDSDGVDDGSDNCPNTALNSEVDANGCSLDQLDTDQDGVSDAEDECEGHNDNVDVDADGTPDGCDPLIDNDGDGVANSVDACEGHDDNVDVDADGTPDGCDPLIDSDDDGVSDETDNCPGTDNEETVDEFGCAVIVPDDSGNQTDNETSNQTGNVSEGGDNLENNSSNQDGELETDESNPESSNSSGIFSDPKLIFALFIAIIVWSIYSFSKKKKGYIELPDGPSGRKPISAIEIEAGEGVPSESYLVLFHDAAMGYRLGETSGPFVYNRSKSFDGSEYTLIHAHEIGTIEKQYSGGKKQTYFLRLTILFALSYSGLFLLTRMNGEWPTLFENMDPYFVPILFVIPIALQAFQHWFNLSSGSIKIYLKSSDPHTFDCSSYDISTAKQIIGLLLLLAFGSLVNLNGGELYCDFLLLIVIVYTTLLIVFGRPINNPELVQEDESMTPLLNLQTFHHKAYGLKATMDLSQRADISLLSMLQDKEGSHLEFKASMWTKYIGTTEKLAPVSDPKKKWEVGQDEVISTVAAFLNAEGGTLLIGVQDKPDEWMEKPANVLGIEPDFNYLRKDKMNTEGYTHALYDMFKTAFSKPSVILSNIDFDFQVFDGKTVCIISVTPVPVGPNWPVRVDLKIGSSDYGKKGLFYVRQKDSSQLQSPETGDAFIKSQREKARRRKKQ